MKGTHSGAIGFGLALMLSASAQAMDNLTVDGYVNSAGGESWKSSSGECVRTSYQDTQELRQECGYEIKVKEKVEVDPTATGTGVAVMEKTQVVKAGEVLAQKKEVVVETFIRHLQFAFDSHDMTDADQVQLEGVVTALDPHRPLLRDNLAYLKIIGHTDSVGAEDYNQKLSERRAQAVADFLAERQSVRREVMQVSGRGESEPMADNDTDEGRATNRRVVIEVVRR